ncbi:RDD family protein [Andreprevotia chitinilytica]|uniref:RDD family protein n=1 Tax=Andreprevotia chitinilytica TaxID=396808 RepID=UPI00054F064E|nr:RDD family protein [Andreprevotia chitinilytica]
MDTPLNPYAPTQTDLEESADGELTLASRGNRFAAALIDGLIGFALVAPYFWFAGIWAAAAQGQQPPFSQLLLIGAFGFVGFVLVHGYLLNRYGQTVGKRVLKIKIVTLDGEKPEFLPLIAKRYLIIHLCGLIPFVGKLASLIDVMFIFRGNRRCLHDLIAGTIVVNASR